MNDFGTENHQEAYTANCEAFLDDFDSWADPVQALTEEFIGLPLEEARKIYKNWLQKRRK